MYGIIRSKSNPSQESFLAELAAQGIISDGVEQVFLNPEQFNAYSSLYSNHPAYPAIPTTHDAVNSLVGLKFDADKPRLDLLSTYALKEIAKVLTFGAEKYAEHNWRKGINSHRLIRAALGHIMDYNNGEDNDKETGLSHLAHAGCCIMFLLELKQTHPELDTRFKPNFKSQE